MSIGIPGVLVLVLSSALQAATPSFQGEPTCGGKPKGTACWRELSSRPGCHVWTSNHEPDASVTWTADCADGMAGGTGTLKWVWEKDRETVETTGRLRAGKRHGRWVMHWADGGVSEGKFAKGRRHGRWVERWTNGTVGEGRYVRGRRHGRWVIRDGYGTTHEGSYRDGMQHGKWVARRDGRVIGEAQFVEGKGRWVDK
ncbi:MAG: hypothetical protein OXH11_06620 [Candidatus Aminicenantes bacterium]|nr:hypothetical protein [Candidatus Aminicenantes bacterium]